MAESVAVDSVQFVKELYPRLREDESAIERYRHAVDLLPPIVVARGRVLVDGFHRLQAHRRELREMIVVEDLGNLTDAEIRRESITRNATHGHQLSQADKRRLAGMLFRDFAALRNGERISEIAQLLSVSTRSVESWTQDARTTEKAEQQARAWDLWLDCWEQKTIATEIGVSEATISEWFEKRRSAETEPPESRQHFDVWNFAASDSVGGVFGRMPPQVAENLLWLFTEPGHIVVDPFAGGGTTIDVAKRMGRRVWASDLHPSTPTLPIHAHDITAGWPSEAPTRADLILLDPPYWQQAKGRYSSDANDMGNLDLDGFRSAWDRVLSICKPHVRQGGFVAFIVSPSVVDDGSVIDHGFEMYTAAKRVGLHHVRRIVVPYTTQQANGQQVTWAREHRQLLKLYRDLVVMTCR
jgi:DNA-binding transcriptional regulator YiaG